MKNTKAIIATPATSHIEFFLIHNYHTRSDDLSLNILESSLSDLALILISFRLFSLSTSNLIFSCMISLSSESSFLILATFYDEFGSWNSTFSFLTILSKEMECLNYKIYQILEICKIHYLRGFPPWICNQHPMYHIISIIP